MRFTFFRKSVDGVLSDLHDVLDDLSTVMKDNDQESVELESVIVQAEARKHVLTEETKRAARVMSKIQSLVE
jgi:hypothetical protein